MTIEFKKYKIGFSNIPLSKYIQDRIDAGELQLLSDPKSIKSKNKKTNSWKPVNRGKNG